MENIEALFARIRKTEDEESAMALLFHLLSKERERGRFEGKKEAAVVCKMWGDEHGIGKEIYRSLIDSE